MYHLSFMHVVFCTLEIRKEMFMESWLDQCSVLTQPTSRAVVAIPNNRCKRIRDALVQYF